MNEDLKTLKELIYIMEKKIQALDDIIDSDDLKDRIRDLEEENKELEQRNQELEEELRTTKIELDDFKYGWNSIYAVSQRYKYLKNECYKDYDDHFFIGED